MMDLLVQPPCLRMVILEHIVWIVSRQFLNITIERDFTILPGQYVSVFGHPHSKVLPPVQVELPVHPFVPITSCPTAWLP